MRSFLCALAACLLCSAASAQTLAYQPVTTLSTGAITPNNLAAGDFNGDGLADIVVPDQLGKTVSVYLNQGGGTFGAPVVTTLNINDTLGAVVVGDINEDGRQDLVISTVSGNQLAIPLLGNGDGTFNQQPGILNSFGFLDGKLADFNGDGHLDLFLGGNGQPYLFFGKGDGTFALQSIPRGSSPGEYFSVAFGDVNGDKFLDAVGADVGSSSITVFKGQQGGGFGSASILSFQSVGPNPLVGGLADFNNDGRPDLLVASAGIVVIAPGNGDGTFQLIPNQLTFIYQSSNQTGNEESSGAPVDLNNDGVPDVAALDETAGILTLVLNDGTGTFPNAFQSPYVYQLPPNSFRMVSADFNGDGLPDFAISNRDGKLISFVLSHRTVTAPNVQLNSSSPELLVGSADLLQVQVTGGAATPTGSITLLDINNPIAMQRLESGGTASFSINSLNSGIHSLTARYSGDATHGAASSAVLTQSITDFQVSLSQSSASVVAGSSATYSINVSPVAGFTGSVVFSCSGLPLLAQCNAATANVSSGATTVNVVVSTTAATTARNALSTSAVYSCTLLGSFFLCYGFPKKRPRWARITAFSLILLAVGLSGCGGNPSSSQKTVLPGTPAGSNSFIITAAATQNGVTVTHALNATLIVQ